MSPPNLRPRAVPRAIGAIASLLLAFVLVACAGGEPPPLPRGAPGVAAAPKPGGLLAEMEGRVAKAAGVERSGFHLLDSNEDGLRWRLALADSATHTLDLQYYVWWGDEAGSLLMRRVLDAADRGVKVRMILDDLSTMLADAASPKVRDREIGMFNAHPNVEIRLFNPWHRRTLAGRAIETVERLERMNHRMHNKLMVADNRAAVIGGRNIGNEYFGLSEDFNFRDLDVLGIGPVARQASSVFDRFWNSEWVTPSETFYDGPARVDGRQRREIVDARLTGATSLARFPLSRQEWRGAFDGISRSLHFGTSQVLTDAPRKDALRRHMPDAMRALFGQAERELLITNAYVIPDDDEIAHLRAITGRGARIRMLTNSLASHDVPAVNSHYKQWRRQLVEAGVELHEARHDAAHRAELADTAPVRSGFMGLHVKAAIVDRARVFIGSMNLDPRSKELNSEMGVIIDSRGLADALAASMERDMHPTNAWRVTLAGDGGLRWSSDREVLSMQPARSFWQRVQDEVFMLFPRDLY
jgi:putative cardiolipin synthase